MITSKYKPVFDRALRGAARAAAATGVSPNQLTLAGLALGIFSCLYLLWSRNLAVFAWLALIFGLLDGLDGAVARFTGKTSKFGSYLDAMCDRYYEIFVLFSVAHVTGYWGPASAMLSGSLLTSYAKARAAMEVSVSNSEWPDLLERAERSVIFVGGLFLSQIFPRLFFGRDLFYWTLILLAAGTHFTAFQRIFRARKIIAARQ
ncbi:MAG: CDP-alcohol phosphatidyltransferase family protein [Candidatus Omnitrophica bacterium]|nr:CDP-alcohol phosphatidyltransferase family protein [Candidatus Omnitrophota bacterium]